MNKSIVYAITIVACIILQLAISPVIAIHGARPDFLLVPVLLVAIYSGPTAGSVTGFFLGLLEDFAGDSAIGLMALTYILTALIVGLVARSLESRSPLVVIVLVIFAAFFSQIVFGFALVLTHAQGTGVISTIVGYALPSGLYTAILGCIGLFTQGLVIGDERPGGMGLGNTVNGGRGYSMPSRFK